MKVRKNTHYEQVLHDSMSLAGSQIIPIDFHFHLKNCLEIFDENSADKIQSKNLS